MELLIAPRPWDGGENAHGLLSTGSAIYPSSTLRAKGGSDHISLSFHQRPEGSEVRSPVMFLCVPCPCTMCLAQSKAINKDLLPCTELKVPGLRGRQPWRLVGEKRAAHVTSQRNYHSGNVTAAIKSC